MKRLILILINNILFISFLVGCAYFNAFYLAQKNFKDAEFQRMKESGIVDAQLYKTAIQWSEEVTEKYSGSRYIDDSLYIIGMSYYHMKDFVLARTSFDELIRKFPESKYKEEAHFYKAKSLTGLKQYDEAREVLNDERTEEDAGVVRYWCSRSQLRAMCLWGLEVVSRGRPLCPQCGEPMESEEDHFCPKKNGHYH